MNINNKNQSQLELFTSNTKDFTEVEKSRYLLIKDLTLSTENIIVMAIIFVMCSVLFFSLGVERGRKTVRPTPKNAVIKPQGLVVEVPSIPIQDGQQAVMPNSLLEETSVASTVGTAQPANVVPKAIEQNVPAKAKEPAIDKNINKNFTIQVASFKEDQLAHKEAKALKQKGFEPTVHKKGKFSIVCVGKFSLKEEAEKFSNKLKRQYKDCLVRRL